MGRYGGTGTASPFRSPPGVPLGLGRPTTRHRHRVFPARTRERNKPYLRAEFRG